MYVIVKEISGPWYKCYELPRTALYNFHFVFIVGISCDLNAVELSTFDNCYLYFVIDTIIIF